MNQNILIDEKALIDQALQAMQSSEPNLPRSSVKKFLHLIGEEIKRNGDLTKDFVDGLLSRLQSGEL